MVKQQMFNTGAEYALSILGGKWKAVIVFLLAGHSWRTGALQKQLGISQKVLADQLLLWEHVNILKCKIHSFRMVANVHLNYMTTF